MGRLGRSLVPGLRGWGGVGWVGQRRVLVGALLRGCLRPRVLNPAVAGGGKGVGQTLPAPRECPPGAARWRGHSVLDLLCQRGPAASTVSHVFAHEGPVYPGPRRENTSFYGFFLNTFEH